MTREEAISVLERIKGLNEKWSWTEPTVEALDMAIEAIHNEMTNVAEIIRLRMLSREQGSKLRAMRITREQVEKMQGEWEEERFRGRLEGWQHRECGRHTTEKSQWCPKCGAPMTDEAVDILWHRLEAMQDAD